jgi:hypothetical protein
MHLRKNMTNSSNFISMLRLKNILTKERLFNEPHQKTTPHQVIT